MFALLPLLQAAATDVNATAADAFGTRVGVESVGLYSERSVRGFSLQDAGNYRIEDAYFIRAAQPANPVVIGTTTRVGIGAVRADFPGPSGLVDYQLRRPTGGAHGWIEAGTRPNSGPFAELNADLGDEKAGLVAGLHLYPRQRYADGGRGEYYGLGLAAFRQAGRLSATGFVTQTFWDYQADTGFAAAGPVLPRPVRPRVYRGQDWTVVRNRTTVAGSTVELGLDAGWRLRGSFFAAASHSARSDFNLYVLGGAGSAATLTVFTVPERDSVSLAGEAVLTREWRTGRLSHRFLAMARGRRSRADIRAGQAFAFGDVDAEAPPRFAEPALAAPPPPIRDRVEQWTAGLGYRLSVGEAIELRVDGQRSRYAKRVVGQGTTDRNVAAPWLYSGALLIAASDAVTVYGSYNRGLEESGVAPNNAANRNAVLPPVLARQAELGFRWAPAGKLSLIGGLFRIDKPVPALTEGGVFALAGDVRHQGVELSLSGALAPRLSLIAGASLLNARLRGPLVARGLLGRVPVGRPDLTALVNMSWRVPGIEGFAVDGGVTWQGREYVDGANRLRTPGFASVNLGLRWQFDPGGLPLTLRARAVNLLAANRWDATASELLFFQVPRSLALSLTAAL